jgi:hypothetical protein
MSSKNESNLVHVGNVPEHLLALMQTVDGSDSLQTMKHHRILNIIAVVKSNSPIEKKKEYGEGSMVIPSTKTVVAKLGESIEVIPVMFFDEFIKWGDRKDTAGPMIREKTLNRSSKLAQLCQNPQTWNEVYGSSQPPYMARNTHHLNFMCLIASGPLTGQLVVVSFARGEFKQGIGWMGSIQQRRFNGRLMPLYASVWELSVSHRANSKGEWYGIDVRPAAQPYASAEQVELARPIHEQLLQDYKSNSLEVDHEQAVETEGVGASDTGEF